MKKFSKFLLSLIFAIVLVCGTSTFNPLMDQSVNEVEAKAKISISKKRVSLYVRKTTTLKMKGTKKKVKWSTSNKKVATVSSKGKVKAVKKGTATITAKVGGKKYKCKVFVFNPTISQTAITLNVGSSAALTVSNAVGAVQWSSSNVGVATVDANGQVRAVSKGTAIITAVASGVKLTCTVNVNEVKPVIDNNTTNEVKSIKVTGLTIAAPSKTMKIGETFNLSPTVSPSNATDKAYTVSSNNPEVASVNSNGIVTAKADGTATITVKTKDQGITKQCAITVRTPLESISVGEDQLSMEINDTKKITCTVNPRGIETTLNYSSDNGSVATVSNDGTIKAISGGAANITVSVTDQYDNIKTAIIKVSVITHVTSINLNYESRSLFVGDTYKIIPTVLPDNANNKGVTYESSAPEVATVDAQGTVTALAAGNTTITVTSKDQAAIKKTVEITVAQTTTTTVSNQNELNAALAENNAGKICISAQNDISLDIAKEGAQKDFSEVSLVINAPNGHIENYANFKAIIIESISNSTYVEHASGNVITYGAQNGSIKIDEDAVASVVVGNGALNLKLENNGTISGVQIVGADTNITLTGSTSQLSMPVTVNENATNTSITTSVDTKISADTTFALTVKSGAENTSVVVNNENSIPTVEGLGRIPVTVLDTGKVDNIVADTPETENTQKTKISGSVTNYDAETVGTIKAYVIPYGKDITPENAIVSADIQENGSFITEEIPIGNYYLYIKAEGYQPINETLIITSAASDTYEAGNIVLVNEDDEKAGDIKGILTDAQTGEPVEAGLTVYIRKGGNNVSGNPLAFTLTDDSGTFTFENLPLGQYTIQVIDQREDADTIYVSTSYNAVVAAAGINSANSTITKIIAGDQVRFVLTWGDKASGASSDLDSHLVGPTADGTGQFHTWFSDKSYYQGDIKYADLDVDDTTWEGPETSTIYVNTKGVYSFYIHDYTNEENPDSDQMSQSSAVVKAYIGDKLMAEYKCPVKAGNLWYVCDYDSSTNKFTVKNEVYKYDGALEDIGVDMLKKYKKLLGEAIQELEKIASDHPSLNIDQAVLDTAKEVLNTSDDASEVMEQYYSIKDILSEYTTGLGISRVYNENDMINEWETYTEGSLNILEIWGFSVTLPDDCVIEASSSESTLVTTSSDLEEYVKTITVTNEYGISKTYYVLYHRNTYMGIRGVTALDDDGEDLIYDYYTDCYEIGEESVYILSISGYADTMPDNLTIETNRSFIQSTIQDSDRDGYEKMVVLSYEDLTKNYYITYEKYVNLNINTVQIWDNGTNLADTWSVEWKWDEEGQDFYVLTITGRAKATEFADNLVITGYGSTQVEIKDSDRSGYEKMVVLSSEGKTKIKTYYILYEYNLNITDVKILDENGTNLVNSWYTEHRWEENDKDFYVLTISGRVSEAEYSEMLNVVGYDDVTVVIEDSDRTDYSKMVILSHENDSKAYYIIYERYVDWSIKTAELLDESGENNLISNWDYGWESDENGTDWRTLTLKGTISKAEYEEKKAGLTITGYDNVTVEIKASDKEEYDEMVVLSDDGMSQKYYLIYEKDVNWYIKTAELLDERGENNLISNWDYGWESDENGTDWRTLTLKGTISKAEYEEKKAGLTITGYDDVTVEIKASDKEEYDEMVVLSDDGMSQKYYLIYEKDVNWSIKTAELLDERGENNLISNWDYSWESDENGTDWRTLTLKGTISKAEYEEKKAGLTITGYDDVTVEIKASDRDGYDEMVVLSSDGLSRTYYLIYEKDVDLSVNSVELLDENRNNMLVSWSTTRRNDFDVLVIRGLLSQDEYVDKLEITGQDGVDVNLTTSDLNGYSRMVVLSSEDKSRTYYISYIYVTEVVDNYYSVGDNKTLLLDADNIVNLDGTGYDDNDFSVWFEFTPTEKGKYRFFSEDVSSSVDSYVTLFDSNYSKIAYDDDGGENNNCQLDHECEAGETYYLALRAYGDSIENVNFKVMLLETASTSFSLRESAENDAINKAGSTTKEMITKKETTTEEDTSKEEPTTEEDTSKEEPTTEEDTSKEEPTTEEPTSEEETGTEKNTSEETTEEGATE